MTFDTRRSIAGGIELVIRESGARARDPLGVGGIVIGARLSQEEYMRFAVLP
jgi:hypothetical protein